jgi:hypothetical protein
MQKHGCFEKEVDLAEACSRGIAVGYVLNSGEEMIDGASGNRCAKDNLIRTVECETNDIAVFQGVSTNLLPIKINAATLTTVFQIVAMLERNGCSVPRDTAIGKLQLISAAASNKKRSLIDVDRTKRRIGSSDLQACFADWG